MDSCLGWAEQIGYTVCVTMWDAYVTRRLATSFSRAGFAGVCLTTSRAAAKESGGAVVNH